jgi:trehalose synthase
MVELAKKSLQAYAPVVGDGILREIRLPASFLKGARVQHINSTAEGGGVAELLAMLTPLMREVGLDASRDVMQEALAEKSLIELRYVQKIETG